MTSANTLATVPSVVDQAAIEDITWGFDATALLVGNEIPVAPVAVLTDISAQATVTLVDAPTVVGNLVTQRIRPGVLAGGHNYRLQVVFNPAGTTNLLDMVLGIRCPF